MANLLYKHSIQHFDWGEMSEREQLIADAPWQSEDNSYITETAGFVPLPVKFKRFLENGLVAQFKENDFTSSDWRTLYADDPDLDISPDDEFDEVQVKLELREQKRLALLQARVKELSTVRPAEGGAPKGVATNEAGAAIVENSSPTAAGGNAASVGSV